MLRRKLGPVAALALFFALVALWMTWPLAARLDRALRWTDDALAGAVAGALYAFAPLRLTYWPWLHVLVTFCFPLLLLAIEGVLWGRAASGVLWLAALIVWQVVLTVYGAALAAVTVV